MTENVERDMVMALEDWISELYNRFGQQKPMGYSASERSKPHYFLHRTFLNENDLLIIFNTKRCRYDCDFCQLPEKSSKDFIPSEDILKQFQFVMKELKHSLSVLDRITLSNEGSILDTTTFPAETLLIIAKCVEELRRVRAFTIETRIEFVDSNTLEKIQQNASRAEIEILTGFESHDPHIRDDILKKNQSLQEFEKGLDQVADSGASLSSYILFKPSPTMTDKEAFEEAERSIDYLVEQCRQRGIDLKYVRINPMYAAKGSSWAQVAKNTPEYKPPRLTDVMRLAEKKQSEELDTYIGLSTEGLDEEDSNYRAREDFSPDLIKPILKFNDNRATNFNNITNIKTK